MKTMFRCGAALFTVLLFYITAAPVCFAQDKFDKKDFYDAMSSGRLDAIDKELQTLKALNMSGKNGYEGALLMRKAGKVKVPKHKLDLFKEGRIKLETAIAADADNSEFRFLRLTIEENAPKIVKYRSDIEKDKLHIQKNFQNLPQTVQQAIIDYSKKSKVLKAEDL